MNKEKLYFIETSGAVFAFYIYNGQTIEQQTLNETDAKILEAYLNERGYILTNN